MSRSHKDPGLLGALDLLAQRRAPYADLLAGIVADALARFPPPAEGPIVEIGAGAGQLRAWLPAAARARAVHTDPSAEALARLRAADPAAVTRVAAAQQLPFKSGSVAAVVGLCVFDAIHAAGAEAAAAAEIARVLQPGGRFVHLLDMATLLETPFAKLAASGLVPIPNVLGDPGDHEWPLDILLMRADWLRGLLALGVPAGDYFPLFLSEPFDVQRATDAFKVLATDGDRRRALAAFLVSTSKSAPLLPFHSAKYLESVLDAAFGQGGAFRVEASEIAARSTSRPRAEAGGVRYRSLCVGHQRLLDEWPARTLTPGASAPPPDAAVMEAGMFVFVAQRARV